jgi:hypothetical protein
MIPFMVNNDIPPMFRAAEKMLAASLEKARAGFQHHGIRGDAAEIAFREMLELHLPRYLAVGTGEAIDSQGGRSGQTDVVIANAEQPFRSSRDEAGVYLIEGLTAAAEVKSRLTTDELGDILEKAEEFKKLRVYDNAGDMIHCAEADRKRFYRCPPYFGFTYENSVAVRTILERLSSAEDVPAPNSADFSLPVLDALFILGKGFAINYRSGETLRREDGSTGWCWNDSSNVLVDMFLWLSAVMPRVQRFQSIVIPYLAQSISGAN